MTLTSYRPDHLTYQINVAQDELVVFSEVWYGPDKGWKAFIDGNPVDHIRANYILRALKVPAGDHVVEFKFEPQAVATGKVLSLVCSVLILLGMLLFAAYSVKKNRQSPAI